MVGDIDDTPINFFGGIPDEALNRKTTESTWLPPKTPLAMSTPITEVPGSILPIPMTQDSVLLPTPRLPITHQEEREFQPALVPIVTHLQLHHFLTLIELMWELLLLFLVWKKARVLLMMMSMKELFIG